MKIVTNDYKEEITKLGKEIDSIIRVFDNDKIATEDSNLLLTENNLNLIVEQINNNEIRETITSEDIYNISIVNKGNLLSTLMKEIDFEVSQDLKVGDIVDCQFGLKVDGDYEYINYGKYIVFSKEKNEDTNTYSYVAFDSMLLSMVEVDDTSIIQGITVQQAIENICDKVGLNVNITSEDIENLPNLENVINENAFNGIEMTYRDVLNMICQCLGLSMIVEDKELKLKALNNEIVGTFDGNYLKNTNVRFSDKYMINSVVLSRSEDTDTIYRRDEESITENGVHEFKIKDNLIMQYDDREDYIDEIFEQLNGVEFYINDFTSTGITYLDWLDYYNVEIDNNTYKCLMLNDEIKIQQGLEETIYTEQPEETVTDLQTSSKTDKEVSFIVDKQNSRINGTVKKDDIIASLNVAIEDGQGIVNLKGNTVTIDSDKFKLDEEGNIIATSGTFGGTVNTSQDLTVGNNAYIGQNQSSSAIDKKGIYFSNNSYIERTRINTQEATKLKSYVTIVDGGQMELQMLDNNAHFYYITNNTLYTVASFTNNSFQLTTASSDSSISGDTNSILISGKSYIYLNHQPTIISDKRLKNNIKDIKVDWIDKLKIKEFEYNKSPNIKQIGLIAQDYVDEDYSKYFINENNEGYYSITYGNITNALIQYCQEMKKEINSLKEEIKQLKESDK